MFRLCTELVLIAWRHTVWLRPSKQIRAPLYSIKQKRQRRWIVVKYGIAYILGFAIFAALVAIRESRLPFVVFHARSSSLLLSQLSSSAST